MLRRAPAYELTDWIAFERLYGPLDLGRRLDFLFAMVCQTIVNVNRDPKKKPDPYPIGPFLPTWDAPEETELAEGS